MDKDIKVFLSSTGRNLHEYREAVYKAISKMKEFKCVRMENFGANVSTPLSTSLNELKSCEVFVGIVGVFYGCAPSEDSKSFTEHEYDSATSNDIPRLMFVTADDFPFPAALREKDEVWDKQKKFRNKILGGQVIDKAETPDKLATNVESPLTVPTSTAA